MFKGLRVRRVVSQGITLLCQPHPGSRQSEGAELSLEVKDKGNQQRFSCSHCALINLYSLAEIAKTPLILMNELY